MLERAKDIINDIAKETDSIILMHSLSGKDSITLLDMVYPKFKRVVCCYLYVIPNLRHQMRYYAYAKRKYPNIEFIQAPHYALYSYIKTGYMGSEANPKQRLWTLADIIDKVRENTGIEWACLGFKQSDSLNRRLMLRSYKDGKEAISWKGKKFYPLSTYKNKDVLHYIRENNLKNPENYDYKSQSAGTSVAGYDYLKWLDRNYPDDLQKVYSAFPATRVIIQQTEAKREAERIRKEHEKRMKQLEQD